MNIAKKQRVLKTPNGYNESQIFLKMNQKSLTPREPAVKDSSTSYINSVNITRRSTYMQESNESVLNTK